MSNEKTMPDAKIQGHYKDEQVEIDIGPTWRQTTVRINGKPVQDVQSVTIYAEVGLPTRVELEIGGI